MNILNLLKPNRYNSIDNTPIGIFIQILETDNTSLLGGFNIAKRWEYIFNEYINYYDLSKEYKQYLNLQQQVIKLYYKAYIKGERHNKTLAKIKQLEANELMQGQIKPDFKVVAASVSKFMAYRIDTGTTSVKEFYSYLKLMHSNG